MIRTVNAYSKHSFYDLCLSYCSSGKWDSLYFVLFYYTSLQAIYSIYISGNESMRENQTLSNFSWGTPRLSQAREDA